MTACSTGSPAAVADWLRSRPSRLLLWAALLMCLFLGVGVVLLTGPQPPGRPAEALGDDAAATQVVTAARRVVAAAQLRQPAAGYAYLSCSSGDNPPYQAVLHMRFAVPQRDSEQYLDRVAADLIADGWAMAATEAEHFGVKLTTANLTAVLEREPSVPESATIRLYGPCLVMGDHRHDDPVWTDLAF